MLFLCLVLVQAYLLFLQLIDAVSERNHLKKNTYILLNNLEYHLLKLPSFLLADLISLSFELLTVVEFDLLQVEKHLPQLLCCLPEQTQTVNQMLNQSNSLH